MAQSGYTQGVLYIAAGDQFAADARSSAESLRTHNDVHVTLYADKAYNYEVFDDVKIMESPRYDQGDSIPSHDQLPYDRTLFLDCDTYVCADITDLFDVLDRVDIGCAFNVGTEKQYGDLPEIDLSDDQRIPAAFYEHNTGVLVLKKSDRMRQFLESWQSFYNAQRSTTRNQLSFRHALYNSELNHVTLPREYNYRLPKLAAVYDEIKIIHGRHPSDIDDIEKKLNNDSNDIRVITKTGWPMGVISTPSAKYLLKYNYQKYGLMTSFKRLCEKIIP